MPQIMEIMKAEADARKFGVGYIAVIRREGGGFEYRRLDPAIVTIPSTTLATLDAPLFALEFIVTRAD